MKSLCDCGEVATWIYAPGDGACCDDCVPRGCGCNTDFAEEDLDIDGRQLPCCEWEYNDEGWILEDYNE